MAREQLFTREMIAARIRELGREISDFYRGKELTVVVLMNGGAFFACDLVREMDIPLWFDSLRASSYIHDRRDDDVQFSGELKLPVSGRHILLADDVFDSGETIKACREKLLASGAGSVRTAVLINKQVPGRKLQPDWAAFSSPDYYLIGFGMDTEEFDRNIPRVERVI